MKHIFLCIVFIISSLGIFAQENHKKVYFSSSSEIMFNFGQMEIDDNTAKNGVRTTFFLNIPYSMHINFNNNIGLDPSVFMKNIGIKTLNEQIDGTTYKNIHRRVLTLGSSLALKIGAFNKNVWFYAGGGIDWAFHYRQKLKETEKSKKIKEGEYLSDATPRIIPSAFVGIQTPYYTSIKFTYYFNDFLNRNYNGAMGNFSKIIHSQLFTLSLLFNFDRETDNILKDNPTPKTIDL